MKKIEKFSKSKLVCFEGFVDSYASKEEGKEVNLSGVEFVESNGETSILNVTMPSQIFKILETDYKKQKNFIPLGSKRNLSLRQIIMPTRLMMELSAMMSAN